MGTHGSCQNPLPISKDGSQANCSSFFNHLFMPELVRSSVNSEAALSASPWRAGWGALSPTCPLLLQGLLRDWLVFPGL